ncbi:MAG: YicC family protein [Defluviitaleaceae bacterium]|nr:YicC family protein [Defluviitaleaceae bacterium]
MVKSMTGYGRGEYSKYNRKFVVEIKSVNHRYNDISVKLPRILSGLEDAVRKTLQAHISRGKTDVFVNYEALGDVDVNISFNAELADSYMAVLSAIKERYSLDDKISISSISRFPDVISTGKGVDGEEAMAELREVLFEAVNGALNSLISMRENEGTALKSDILDKLSIIAHMSGKIAKKAPEAVEAYKEKFRERISDNLKNIGVEIDEARLLMEIAIFSDRACVDEELTRLSSHLEQMRQILETPESIGRKLDFLVQEMNREVNTIGSKAHDTEITQIVVDLKAEIEKIREQVQNIE